MVAPRAYTHDVEPFETILVADDDDVFRERLVRAFQDRGYRAVGAPTSAAALELGAREHPSRSVVDLRLPEEGGLSVVEGLKSLDPGNNVVVLTGYGSIATALDAVRLGATHYLQKPATVDDLLAAFAREDEPGPVSEEAEVPSLARVEWEHLNRVLADCDGNISKAARLLGLHRRSLQRKLAKYPVHR